MKEDRTMDNNEMRELTKQLDGELQEALKNYTDGTVMESKNTRYDELQVVTVDDINGVIFVTLYDPWDKQYLVTTQDIWLSIVEEHLELKLDYCTRYGYSCGASSIFWKEELVSSEGDDMHPTYVMHGLRIDMERG